MNNYKNWPDGAVAIAIDKESMLMRFVLADGSAICGQNRVIHYADSDYKTTIATREPEPENKGYQLADGSWSSEYKEGDLFEVVEVCDAASFAKGSVVKYVDMDGSAWPGFELVSGFTKSAISCTYEYWGNLKPHSKKQQHEPITNTKNLEFMHACYQRGISIDDAEYLWGLKNT